MGTQPLIGLMTAEAGWGMSAGMLEVLDSSVTLVVVTSSVGAEYSVDLVAEWLVVGAKAAVTVMVAEKMASFIMVLGFGWNLVGMLGCEFQ